MSCCHEAISTCQQENWIGDRKNGHNIRLSSCPHLSVKPSLRWSYLRNYANYSISFGILSEFLFITSFVWILFKTLGVYLYFYTQMVVSPNVGPWGKVSCSRVQAASSRGGGFTQPFSPILRGKLISLHSMILLILLHFRWLSLCTGRMGWMSHRKWKET